MDLFKRKPPPQAIEAAEREFLEGKSDIQAAPGKVLFDEQLGVYQRWYFEFRLKEEVARATRSSTSFGVLVILLGARDDPTDEMSLPLLSEAAHTIVSSLRATDLVATLDPGVFAVCLVNCDPRAAEVAAGRVEAAISNIPHSIGGTMFPQDNLGPEELLKLARHRAGNAGAYNSTYSDKVEIPPWQR